MMIFQKCGDRAFSWDSNTVVSKTTFFSVRWFSLGQYEMSSSVQLPSFFRLALIERAFLSQG